MSVKFHRLGFWSRRTSLEKKLIFLSGLLALVLVIVILPSENHIREYHIVHYTSIVDHKKSDVNITTAPSAHRPTNENIDTKTETAKNATTTSTTSRTTVTTTTTTPSPTTTTTQKPTTTQSSTESPAEKSTVATTSIPVTSPTPGTTSQGSSTTGTYVVLTGHEHKKDIKDSENHGHTSGSSARSVPSKIAMSLVLFVSQQYIAFRKALN